MVCSGDRDVIGSWKIIAMRPPRMSRMAALSASRPAMSTGVAGRRIVEQDRAAADRRLLGQDLQDRLRGDGFARAGFTHERNSLAFGDIEGQPVHGPEVAGIRDEIHRQLADGQERLIHRLLQQRRIIGRITRYSSTTFPILSQNNFRTGAK